MSVKPLDLQVNMQSTMEVAKVEAERQEKIREKQKDQQLKNIQDTKKNDQRVEEAEEKKSTENLKDKKNHFGILNHTEDEADEYHKRRVERDQNTKEKSSDQDKNSSSKKNKKKKKNSSKQDYKNKSNNGHISFKA